MSETAQGRRSIVLILVVIAFAALMDGLDGSIVNVALPTMATDFGTDTGTIAWVAVIYFVMMAGLMLTFARIAKNGLIKKILFLGLVIFTISSLFCGISTSFPMLLVFRTVQGIGAAMMGAAIPMACVKYLPPFNLGLGMGVLTMGSSLGFALGPVVGGILTDILSWHWIFLINVPLGLIIIVLLLKVLPADEGYNGSKIDITGAALLLSAIVFGVLALERAPYSQEAGLVVFSAVACVLLLAAFIIVELRKLDPILNVRVFKNWKFDSVLFGYMLANLTYMGMLYLMPFYMHICMGFSSSISGLYLLISPVLTLILCIPISRLSDRTERRAFSVAACFILTVGCVVMAMFSRESVLLPLVVTLVCMGLMWAFCGGPMGSRIVENITDESREMGSSLMNEFVYLGGTIGTALFAMLFTIGSGAGNISFSDLPPEIFLDGFVFTMIIAALISTVSMILSMVVKEPKRSRS